MGCSNSGSKVIDNGSSDEFVYLKLNPRNSVQNAEALAAHMRTFHKDYADAAANAWEGLRGVVDKYGYDIKTQDGLDAYNSIIEKVESLMPNFTESEMESINNLVASMSEVEDPEWDKEVDEFMGWDSEIDD